MLGTAAGQRGERVGDSSSGTVLGSQELAPAAHLEVQAVVSVVWFDCVYVGVCFCLPSFGEDTKLRCHDVFQVLSATKGHE